MTPEEKQHVLRIVSKYAGGYTEFDAIEKAISAMPEESKVGMNERIRKILYDEFYGFMDWLPEKEISEIISVVTGKILSAMPEESEDCYQEYVMGRGVGCPSQNQIAKRKIEEYLEKRPMLYETQRQGLENCIYWLDKGGE